MTTAPSASANPDAFTLHDWAAKKAARLIAGRPVLFGRSD